MVVSLDVEKHYPSIPRTETIEISRNHLNRNKPNDPFNDIINKALSLCLIQNTFEFAAKFYSLREDLIKDNPLSPFIAEIFMNKLGLKIHKSIFKDKIRFWHRYVDDIIICFSGTDRQLDSYLEYLKNLHKNINFDPEKENYRQISFLYITLKRNNNINFEFDIYLKPSHSDLIIHETSAHPPSHKLATFHSYIHRLFALPFSE